MITKIFFTSLFLLCFNVGYCCDCDSVPTVKQSMLDNSLIFAGKLISKRMVPIRIEADGIYFTHRTRKVKESPLKSAYYEYIFDVICLYKGQYNRRILVYSDYLESACGVNLELGTRYIVYANNETVFYSRKSKREKIYKTSSCTRTMIYSNDESKLLMDH